ncbi:MAG TPA: hypothetical protein GXX29_05180 [Firmicutes bacterium]|nr:hypothetical protein [Bacillota bacterium]
MTMNAGITAAGNTAAKNNRQLEGTCPARVCPRCGLTVTELTHRCPRCLSSLPSPCAACRMSHRSCPGR